MPYEGRLRLHYDSVYMYDICTTGRAVVSMIQPIQLLYIAAQARPQMFHNSLVNYLCIPIAILQYLTCLVPRLSLEDEWGVHNSYSGARKAGPGNEASFSLMACKFTNEVIYYEGASMIHPKYKDVWGKHL